MCQKSDKSALAILGPRALTALVTLCAMRLTYSAISADAFLYFNLLLFTIALAGVASSPLTQMLWSQYSETSFIASVYGSVTISAFIIIPPIILYTPASDSIISKYHLLSVGPALIYGCSRTIERLFYSRGIFEYDPYRAALIPLLFGLSEVIVSTGLVLTNSHSYPIRLLGPCGVFFAALYLSRQYRDSFQALRPKTVSHHEILSLTIHALISTRGFSVLLLFALTTLASTVERSIFVNRVHIAGLPSEAVLLALAYTIGWQSMLNSLIDLGRRRIVQHNVWQPNARNYVLRSIAIALLGAALLVIAHPVLQMIEILPRSVSIIPWTVLIIRATCIFITNLALLDQIQRNRFRVANYSMGIYFAVTAGCCVAILHDVATSPLVTGAIGIMALGTIYHVAAFFNRATTTS